MQESPFDGEAPQDVAGNETEPIEYPVNRVVGILDTPAQTTCAVDGLVGGGFLESEVAVGHGPEPAERLASGTGRRGFQDWFIRFTERLGHRNAEMEMRDRYEQALRDGHTVIGVQAPTEERKDLAVQILRNCGAHFVNFFGRFNVEQIVR
ncbi:MAG: hypothetical protein ACJ8AP_16510 [Gemmatimonadales bacterium]